MMLSKLDLKSKAFLIILAALFAYSIVDRLIHPRAPMVKPEPVIEKPTKPTHSVPGPIYLELRAKRDVLARLKDPDSAEFSGITTHGRVVCGYVNSRNGLGGMSGKQRFISGVGAITALEEDMGESEMANAWARLC